MKTASQTDSNAAKTIALDHLGVIAARIRSSTLKVQRLADENNNGKKALWPLDDGSICALSQFLCLLIRLMTRYCPI